MKLQEVNTGKGKKYSVNLPLQIVKFVGWQKGQELELVMGKNKGELIIREKLLLIVEDKKTEFLR